MAVVLMGRTSLSSLHVHGPVAILISKMKQEKRKKKKKKILPIEVVVLAVMWPSSLMVSVRWWC